MKCWSLCLAALVLASVSLASGTASDSVASYGDQIDSLLARPTLRGASWSVLVYSITDDSAVYERDADRRLVPASVAKLVTSAAALDALGPDYSFETSFYTAGRIDAEGTLHGDLIVRAGGDPMISPEPSTSLGVPVLRTWADSLRARGLLRIDGNIILQTWPFHLQVNSPDWEVGDVNDRFGPTVDGFAFNSNVCHVSIFPGAFLGASAILSAQPTYSPVDLQSTIVTGPAGGVPDIFFRLTPEDTVVHLTGVIPLGDDGEYIWVSVQNPALFFGRALYQALQSGGIMIRGGVSIDRSPHDSDGRAFFVHRSPPLSEVIKLMNKESDNCVAEYVLRALGATLYRSGDLHASVRAETRFLRQLGITDLGISLRDGSGLARQDLCSASGLVDLLKVMYFHPASDSYIASMAVSGTDGTIGYRMSSPELAGRVHAKTGTINHVSNLAGYLYGEHDQVFAFAILCNNFLSSNRQNVRATQDAILECLYRSIADHFTESEN